MAIYEFLRDVKRLGPDPQIEKALTGADPNPVIARRAAGWESPIARMTLDVFMSAYGAEAGDLALTLLATGGVYVGGRDRAEEPVARQEQTFYRRLSG